MDTDITNNSYSSLKKYPQPLNLQPQPLMFLLRFYTVKKHKVVYNLKLEGR